MNRLDERLRTRIMTEFKKTGSIRETARVLHMSRSTVWRVMKGACRVTPTTSPRTLDSCEPALPPRTGTKLHLRECSRIEKGEV